MAHRPAGGTKMTTLAWLLLLALPACGHVPFVHIDTLMAPVEWVTMRVDSLNVGKEDCGNWVASGESRSRAWTETYIEHDWVLSPEWQAQKAVLPKPQLSPFDSLKARLVVGDYFRYVFTEVPVVVYNDSFNWRAVLDSLVPPP